MGKLMKLMLGVGIAAGMLTCNPRAVLARGGADDGSGSSQSSSGSSSSAGSSSSRGHGDDASSSSSARPERRTNLDSRLPPKSGSTSGVSGRIRYRLLSASADERLEISVKIPIGSVEPLVASMSEAQLLTPRAEIVRGGSVIAACDLDFDSFREGASSVRAEYKVSARELRRNRVFFKTGSCNLVKKTGIVPGVPSFASKDLIRVRINADAPFLELAIR